MLLGTIQYTIRYQVVTERTCSGHSDTSYSKGSRTDFTASRTGSTNQSLSNTILLERVCTESHEQSMNNSKHSRDRAHKTQQLSSVKETILSWIQCLTEGQIERSCMSASKMATFSLYLQLDPHIHVCGKKSFPCISSNAKRNMSTSPGRQTSTMFTSASPSWIILSVVTFSA